MKDIGDFSKIDNSGVQQNWIDMLEYFDQLPDLNNWRHHSIQALSIEPHFNILDAGCGMGGATRLFAKHLSAPGHITGIDLSQTLIEIAQQKQSSSVETYLQGDICQTLPFADNTFDAIRRDRVLHHTQHPAKAIEQFKRVLKPGGKIIFSEPDFSMWQCYPMPPQAVANIAETFSAAVCHPRIGIQLPQYLIKAGFTVRSSELYGIGIDSYQKLNHFFEIGNILTEKMPDPISIITQAQTAEQQGSFVSVFPQFSVLAAI